MKRKFKNLLSILIVGSVFTGCSNSTSTVADTQSEAQMKIEETDTVTIKESPDKYTWYMQNYVGRNLATVGYYSLGGDLLDKYGSGYIQMILITENGKYIDISDEEQLKLYSVVEQSYAPNTEIKYVFDKDSEGEEYSNLIDWQNIEQMDLVVKEVNRKGKSTLPKTVEITPSPDKYNYYIRNYVGKNLTQVGYVSLGGDLLDAYGAAHVELLLIADDGSYIDINDMDMMAKYYVVSQDIAANTLLTCTYDKDSEGKEYSNLIDTQNIEKISLHCKKVEE